MWTRKELKDKAKASFKANYWKTVFAALVLLVVVGGMSLYSSASSTASTMSRHSIAANSLYSPDDVNVEVRDGKVVVDVDDHYGRKVHVNMDADDLEELGDALDDIADDESISHWGRLFGPGALLAGLSIMLVMLIIMAVAISLYVFVLSPLEVGAQRFFVRNLNQRAEVKELAFGYDNNYKEVVKTIFLRGLFIFLWSLLLIIPGIYKAYEYRMIPYLLADDPTMTKDRAFAESKRMMDGQKWNTFVLDLSFLGWNILSAMTLGILGVFYVCPYQMQTNAALYEKLRYGLPAPEQPMQAVPVAPVAPAATANAEAQAMPVIVPESQPPVPPFAQVGAQPENGLDMTAPLPEGEPDVTAPLPEGEPDAAAPLPESGSGVTAPLPESGIDPTESMPAVEKTDAASDSPDA